LGFGVWDGRFGAWGLKISVGGMGYRVEDRVKHVIDVARTERTCVGGNRLCLLHNVVVREAQIVSEPQHHTRGGRDAYWLQCTYE